MPAFLARAPLLVLLPTLLAAAAPPAASKPAGAVAPANATAPAKNSSLSVKAKEAAPNASTPVTKSIPAVKTAAIKIASTAKVASPILAKPNTGAIPKTIQRHLQQQSGNETAAQAVKARLRAARDSSVAHLIKGAVAQNATDFLAHASAECECHFTDMCECHSAMEFMKCVAKACASGACDCRKYEFMDACGAIANTCPSLAISCGKERSECIHEEVAKAPEVVTMPKVKAKKTPEEIYDELRELKETKCRLEVAMNDGWLNAKGQLEETNHEIQELINELATMGAKMPEMHCQKHFEEWTDAPTSGPKEEESVKEVAEIKEEPETETPKAVAGAKPKVPLWSAPPRSGASHQASPLLLVAGLVSAVLGSR